MRQHLRAEHPLGSQICEGETDMPLSNQDLAAETARQSLALGRSNSYTLADGSGLPGLLGEESSGEDSDHGNE